MARSWRRRRAASSISASRARRSIRGQEFLVVTNYYRASGGGDFPGCDGTTIVYEAPDSNRDVLVRYIHETGHLDPRSDDNWRFAPWPDTAIVTFLTSPAAANVPPPSQLTITPIGAAAGGFVEYRISPKNQSNACPPAVCADSSFARQLSGIVSKTPAAAMKSASGAPSAFAIWPRQGCLG